MPESRRHSLWSRMRTARAGHIWVIAALVLVSAVALVKALAAAEADENATDAAAPIVEEEVVFRDGPTSLVGTLFRRASGPVQPAVVVLAGSDRSDQAYQKLMDMAQEDEDGLHWGAGEGLVPVEGKGITGRRGDRIIVDDPHSVENVESDVVREVLTELTEANGSREQDAEESLPQ